MTYLIDFLDLATYDRTKQWILKNTEMKDNWATHVSASLCSGLAAATVSTPADVVKTRIMDQIRQMHDSGGQVFLVRFSIFLLEQQNAFTVDRLIVSNRSFKKKVLLRCIEDFFLRILEWLLGV